MLMNVSWMDYGWGVVLVGSIYYLVVGLQYYPAELQSFFSGKGKLTGFNRRLDPNGQAFQEHVPVVDDSHSQGSEDAVRALEFLMATWKTHIAEASQAEYTSAELINSLKREFADYSPILDSPLRTRINKWICSECEKYGTITLSEEDMLRLWEEGV